jgi:hypothetical protein
LQPFHCNLQPPICSRGSASKTPLYRAQRLSSAHKHSSPDTWADIGQTRVAAAARQSTNTCHVRLGHDCFTLLRASSFEHVFASLCDRVRNRMCIITYCCSMDGMEPLLARCCGEDIVLHLDMRTCHRGLLHQGAHAGGVVGDVDAHPSLPQMQCQSSTQTNDAGQRRASRLIHVTHCPLPVLQTAHVCMCVVCLITNGRA